MSIGFTNLPLSLPQYAQISQLWNVFAETKRFRGDYGLFAAFTPHSPLSGSQPTAFA